jgi:type IV pilus assembly protein PilM
MLSGKFPRVADWLARFGPSSGATGPLVGLDLGSSAIKLVELSRHGKTLQLERYLIEPLPRDAIVDGNLGDLERVAGLIRAACGKLGSPTREVAIALPTPLAIYKTLRLPLSSHDELEALVDGEAGQLIPFPLDEVNLDFQVLGPSSGRPEDLDVLVCAARKERVEERVAVAELAGLRPTIVDVEAFAAFAALEQIRHQLPEQGLNQTVALFDLSGHKLRCHVVRNGLPLYFREQTLGGAQLTREIQQLYELDWAGAEAAKRHPTLPDGCRRELLQPFVDSLAQEVARALQFFASTVSGTQYRQVDCVLLSGGTSLLPGLDEAVADRTQLGTLLANPFTTMTPAPMLQLDALRNDAPSLLTACGLALRGVER